MMMCKEICFVLLPIWHGLHWSHFQGLSLQESRKISKLVRQKIKIKSNSYSDISLTVKKAAI